MSLLLCYVVQMKIFAVVGTIHNFIATVAAVYVTAIHIFLSLKFGVKINNCIVR